MMLFSFLCKKKFFSPANYFIKLFISGIFFLNISQNISSPAHAAGEHIVSSSTYSHSYQEKLSINERNISVHTPPEKHSIMHAIENFFHKYLTPKFTAAPRTKNSTRSLPIAMSANELNTNPLISIFTHPFTSILHGFLHNNFLSDLSDNLQGIADLIVPSTLTPSAETLAHANGKIPVILLHGTSGNPSDMLNIYHSLTQEGIPAYAPTLGYGTNSIYSHIYPGLGGLSSLESSTQQLTNFIAKVERETGSTQVDLVGHSQGGLLIKNYIAQDNKANVHAVIDLSADNHGSTLSGFSDFLDGLAPSMKKTILNAIGFFAGKSLPEQLPDSPFIQNLNKFPDTKAGIHYLVLSTRDDLIQTPYNTTYLHAVPGAFVTNEEVHSLPGVKGFISHFAMVSTPGIVQAVTKYIMANGEPRHAPENVIPNPPQDESPNANNAPRPTVSLLG